MDMTEIPTEVLQMELDRREAEAEARAVPKPLANPDWGKLAKACADHIATLAEDGCDDVAKTYIYEAAMSAIYGKDVWKWISSRIL